jgi:predicted N-acetyltransferase YhbS
MIEIGVLQWIGIEEVLEEGLQRCMVQALVERLQEELEEMIIMILAMEEDEAVGIINLEGAMVQEILGEAEAVWIIKEGVEEEEDQGDGHHLQ